MKITANIEVEIGDEPFEALGRGWVYPARITRLPSGAIGTDVFGSVMRGVTVCGQRVLGVEMFMTFSQHTGSNIGLLFKDKLDESVNKIDEAESVPMSEVNELVNAVNAQIAFYETMSLPCPEKCGCDPSVGYFQPECVLESKLKEALASYYAWAEKNKLEKGE